MSRNAIIGIVVAIIAIIILWILFAGADDTVAVETVPPAVDGTAPVVPAN